jgi:N-methylhydantoinase A
MDTDRFQVGTDVGGTFTDLWAIAGDGRQAVVKAPTTADIVTGILDAVRLGAQAFGLTVEEFCARVDRFGHGTTAGLNALLTGNASVTAVVTTEGFGDTLEIGRLKRQVAGLTDLEVGDYLHRGRWAPLVPRTRVIEVRERIDRTGDVVVPLDEGSVTRALDRIEACGAEAVAVCTLWSVANPAHEVALGQAVSARFPSLFVSLSHQVAPGVGEYARMATTTANAALGPVMGAYLSKLDEELRRAGLRVPVQVMTGAGGVVPTDEVAREPVGALTSGPAAGIIAGQLLGQRLGTNRLLTIDVGGTSFDVGVIVDGAPLMSDQVTIGGADIRRPAIDVGTIGAGGGSVARVEAGALRVGPRSAGAVPGPACYGRGGTEATATDADLVLGVLDEDGFAGGTMRLSRAAAVAAIAEQIAAPLGMSTVEAAWGVRQVLDSKMADLLRSVTIERGHDPREFVMLAGGGQGPSHAWALCQDLGIRTFVVTPTATGQSAFGTGSCDLRVTAQQPCYLRIPPGQSASEADLARLEAALTKAGEAASRRLALAVDEGQHTVERVVSLRYRGQAHHLEVPLPQTRVGQAAVEKLLERFEAQYEALFGAGSAFREAGFELLSVRALATAPPGTRARPLPSDPLLPAGSRSVVFDDPNRPSDCPVWTTAFPAPGQRVDGPCLVVYPGQTLVVPPGATGRTDELGNMVVTLEEEPA